ELPGRDIPDRVQDRAWAEEIWRWQLRQLEELDDGAEARAIEEAPHDDGDDAWYGVGDEERQPEEATQSDDGGIHQERERQGGRHHHGYLHGAKQDHAPDAVKELRVAQRLEIVVRARPDDFWRAKAQAVALEPVETL